MVEFKNLLELYAAAFLSPFLPPFLLLPMSDQCLLLSLYEGLLWRETLRRRGKEACSCFAIKVMGENN